MSKESLPIKVRGNLIRIDSKVFTEKFIFLRRRKRKRLQKRRKTKRFWGRDIFKERKSQVIFTTSWKSYDLEIMNIISGKLMYMGYGDGKF